MECARAWLNRGGWVVVAVVVGLLVAGGVVAVAYAMTPTVPSTAVRQVFVDVDGDGRLDLLLYGEVVLNAGPLASPPSP